MTGITGFENGDDLGPVSEPFTAFTRAVDTSAFVEREIHRPRRCEDEKKIELITLHIALRKLDKDMDYSAVVNPLLADQGPALAHIPRLTKTIQRLEKIKADFLRNEQEQLRAAPLAAPSESANGAQIHLTHSIESITNNPDNGRGHAEIRIDDRHEQENCGPRIQFQTMLDSQLEVQLKFMRHAACAAGAQIKTAHLSPWKSCHVGDD
jgi:hypothetical protein